MNFNLESLAAASAAANTAAPTYAFASALARQSTGMLEASELHENLITNKFKGEASARAADTMLQLQELQRGNAASVRRALAMADYTCWRDYPASMYFGMLNGVRVSVLSSSNTNVGGLLGSSSVRGVGGGLATISSIPVTASSDWELETLPNHKSTIAELQAMCRSTAGAGLFAGGGLGGPSKAARFYRRHCCSYQFGPDIPQMLEGGLGGVIGGAATSAPATGPAGGPLRVPTGAAAGGGDATNTAGVTDPTNTNKNAPTNYNITDVVSYIRYIEAFVSAFEVFKGIHKIYKQRVKGVGGGGGNAANLGEAAVVDGYNTSEAIFEDLDFQSIKKASSDASSAGSSNHGASYTNDHTMTLMCHNHPRHKNFSLHLFFERGNRMSAILVSDSPAFQRDITHQLKKVLAAAEWFNGALFVQDLTDTVSGSRGGVGGGDGDDSRSCISPVHALVDVVLNANLLCETAAPPTGPPPPAPLSGRKAAPVNDANPPPVPTSLVHKASCTIVTSYPFSGGQQREVMLRLAETSPTTIPYRKTYAAMLKDAAAEEEAERERQLGKGGKEHGRRKEGGGDGTARSPSSATRRAHHSRLRETGARNSTSLQSAAAGEGEGGAATSEDALPPAPLAATRHTLVFGGHTHGSIITPRCFRAVMALLVDIVRLNSFEAEGMLMAPVGSGLGIAGGGGGQGGKQGGSADGGASPTSGATPAGGATTGGGKGITALTVNNPTGKAGGGPTRAGLLRSGMHAAISSKDLGSSGGGGGGIISYRLYPTRLCGEDWVTILEQQGQGIDPDDSGLPKECMFYPSRLRFRRVDEGYGSPKKAPTASNTNSPQRAIGAKHPTRDDDDSTTNSIMLPSSSTAFLNANFAIENTILWFLDDDDDELEEDEE